MLSAHAKPRKPLENGKRKLAQSKGPRRREICESVASLQANIDLNHILGANFPTAKSSLGSELTTTSLSLAVRLNFSPMFLDMYDQEH